MAVLSILHHPDPRLRKKAQPVTQFTSALQKTIDDMLETMYAAHGIGLAATQVNIQKQIIVIDVSEERNQPLVFINPSIVSSNGSVEHDEDPAVVLNRFASLERALPDLDVGGAVGVLHRHGVGGAGVLVSDRERLHEPLGR